jgi:prophage antirepressor-like protein
MTATMNNNILSVFNFETKNIRLVDNNNKPWFLLRDVLEAMGSKTSVTNALLSIEQGLGEGFSIRIPLSTAGGEQQVIAIAEAAVTYLVARSNTEVGRRLNRFLHTVVLPAIRENGYYVSPAINNEQLQKLQSSIEDLNNKILEKDKLINKQKGEIKMLRSNPQFEKTYQQWVNDIFGGQREIPVGNNKDKRKNKKIDIMTDKFIIECKHVKKWKESIAQIELYKLMLEEEGRYNNEHLVIFLFNDKDEEYPDLKNIRIIARKLGISVGYYKNMAGYVDANELIPE